MMQTAAGVRLWGPAREYALMGARRRALGQITPEVAPEAAAAIVQLNKLADSIRYERASAAGEFKEYIENSKKRVDLVFAQKTAQDKLNAEQKKWEAAHRNMDELAAAQAAYDQVTGELAALTAKVAEQRAAVDQRQKNISDLRTNAEEWIKSLPPEMQTEGRRIIDPCFQPGMGRPAPAPARPVRVPLPFPGAPRPVQVRIAGMYRPPGLSQLIELKPQVNVPTVNVPISAPISIELGGLPLSVGLFAGSGITFLVRSGLPEGWPQGVATVVGAGLAVGGVVNLFLKKSAAAAPAPPPPTPAGPPPPPPSGAPPAEGAPPAFQPPTGAAFSMIQFEVVSPKAGEEIAHSGWFLVGDKIPVTLRMFNPSGETVTFNLEFEWDEFPSVIGYNLASSHGSKAFQVTLGPNEEKNQGFDLPVATSGAKWTAISVAMTIFKKRLPTENRQLVANFTFNLT